jgi:hypothetical protein
MISSEDSGCSGKGGEFLHEGKADISVNHFCMTRCQEVILCINCSPARFLALKHFQAHHTSYLLLVDFAFLSQSVFHIAIKSSLF